MSLLETTPAQRWLNQFEATHKDGAIALIDALVTVPTRDVEAGLQGAIIEYAKKQDRPIAVFVAREIYKSELQKYGIESYLGNFDQKTFRPNAVAPGPNVGSEGRLSMMARAVERLNEEKVLSHPSVAMMKKARVRKIVIVDDLIGSGNRIEKFIQALYTHKTIKSWMSYNLTEFVVFAYAATLKGKKRLRSIRPRIKIHTVAACPTISNYPWPQKTRDDVRFVCESYGMLTSHEATPLGFDNVGALLAFEYGCPNNVPPILWSGSSVWRPMFPRQVVTTELQREFKEPRVAKSLVEKLADLNQVRLSQSAALLDISFPAQRLVLFLTFAKRRIRDIEGLSLVSGLSPNECRVLRETCLEWQLIDEDNLLTEQGRYELRRFQDYAPKPPRVDNIGKYYYPVSLKRP